ncbi:type VI secretion system ATPase TssH [Phycisphaeraceae bacterium D3-23]
MNVSLKSLVQRLNPVCHRALEAAAGLCLSQTNYNVEIEHWLMKLIEADHTDLIDIFRRFEVDEANVRRDLTQAIDRFKTGNSRPPALSPDTVQLAQNGWLLGSIEFGESKTRSGHLLLALLSERSTAALALNMSPQFSKISADVLAKEFKSITEDSAEAKMAGGIATADRGEAGAGPGGAAHGGPSSSAALDQFTIDLTAVARAGKIDPVLGRDAEVRQIVDILLRRRQNNPILTGEAGVGKTAVVEGFALKIAAGEVPQALKDVSLRSLDLGLLQAGAGIKGEFENRLRGVIDEVKASPKPIIMFIDEAHMMIGAGGQAGQGDAANLLKPALARGELRTIAATTWAEYKKYFEKDPALTRRFQVVKVEEPSELSAIDMMRGVSETLEKHHKVRILDEAVEDSVRLSSRYISGRQLPDKSVSLLDTACARVAMGHQETPPAVQDRRRQIEQLGVRIGILERESSASGDHIEIIAELRETQAKTVADLAVIEERWKAEAELVQELNALRAQLEGDTPEPAESETQDAASGETEAPAGAEATDGDAPAADGGDAPAPPPLTDAERAELQARFKQVTDDLRNHQGDEPLVQPCVDAQAVAEVVSAWTGIPSGRMMSDEINTVLQLGERMQERVVGQDHALETIAQSIRTSRADLTDPNKPIGVFLMPGPSGVGKTETAMTLAELLYGGEQNATVINMSEFKEEHKVSLLMGSPPGYVGYGEGGVLTEAVRRKPYSVVLLDEMEKAHPGVQDIFYQVFDKGMLKDGEGRDIDFKNTVVIMTSNAASDSIMKLCADEMTRPDAEGLGQAIYPDLLKTFKPAFLGRCTIVPYFPLADDVMRKIIQLKLGKIVRRVQANYGADLTYDEALIDTIAERCTEVESGARNVDNIISRTLLPELSAEFLQRMVTGEDFATAKVSVGEGGSFVYTFE